MLQLSQRIRLRYGLVCLASLSVALLVACKSTSNTAVSRTGAAARPRVLIQTEAGEITVELFQTEAPITVSNFLRYVDANLFQGGRFFRTVTMDNQPTNTVKIQVIQAEADSSRRREYLPPIPLERTRDTGVKHLDGTLSMARNGPDTAQDSFSICIGNQPELDFGGKRNPDGQGFAAFGRVIRGMDVVRKIQSQRADGQRLTPPVRIQGAVRME